MAPKKASAHSPTAFEILELIGATARCVQVCAEAIEKNASASRHNAARTAETIEAAARTVEAAARSVCQMADVVNGVRTATPSFGDPR